MIKVYLKVVFIVSTMVAEFGLLAPFLMSQKDDISVVLGIASIIAYFPIAWSMIKSIVSDVNQVLNKHLEKLNEVE